jgi:hypothetical protein
VEFFGLAQTLHSPTVVERDFKNVGLPFEGGTQEMSRDTVLHSILEKLKPQIRGLLADKEYEKVSWLYDRIASRLGVPLSKSYPRAIDNA